jgi:hypothetical protein
MIPPTLQQLFAVSHRLTGHWEKFRPEKIVCQKNNVACNSLFLKGNIALAATDGWTLGTIHTTVLLVSRCTGDANQQSQIGARTRT